MDYEMDRRKFIKTAAAAGTAFLTGDFWLRAALAGDEIQIPAAERIAVTVITDNYADFLKPHDRIARRPVARTSPMESIMHAEHGLAYHVQTIVNGRSHAFFFDFGSVFPGVLRNLDLLKIDMKTIEALAVSHNHFDHQAALLELLKAYRADIPQGTPLFVGESFFDETFMKQPHVFEGSLLALKREDIERLELVRIMEVKRPTPIIPGACLMGRIKKVTNYENGSPVFFTGHNAQFTRDDFIGEQAVVLNAGDKGLVVLAGCAHRGIINTVLQAQRLTGRKKIHAIIGGFHLSGASPQIIHKTVADMKSLRPDFVVPTHCTGSDAMIALAREMPNQFIQNTAGTRYVID